MTEPERPDASELLRRRNPAPPEDYADLGRTEAARAVMERIMVGEQGAFPKRAPWWRRRRVIIPVIAAIAIGASAAGYELSQPVTNPTTVGCYADPSLHVTLVVVLPYTGGSFTALCVPKWQHGPLGYSGAPPLFACVMRSGGVGVFPGRLGSPCAQLGLPPAAPPGPGDEAIARAQEQLLTAQDAGNGCWPEASALREAAAIFERTGLDGWRVLARPGFGPHDRCASISIDPSTRTVYLVPG